MARARNIKPSIMDNEELAELEPMTRLLFIYLWMLADREGRLEDRPKRIAAQALPYDRQADVGAMLDELHKAGFIERYEANDLACIQITAFAKHQNPHIRESASSLPAREQGTTKAVQKHNLGSAEASPRSPDSGFSDSGFSDSGLGTAPAAQSPRKRSAPPAVDRPGDVTEQTWSDWLSLRKKKSAPVTQTVVDGAKAEAAKAGMTFEEFLRVWCLRGSQGLQAEWLKPHERPAQAQSFAQQDELARRKRWEEMTGRKWPEDGDRSVIDVTPTTLELS